MIAFRSINSLPAGYGGRSAAAIHRTLERERAFPASGHFINCESRGKKPFHVAFNLQRDSMVGFRFEKMNTVEFPYLGQPAAPTRTKY